MGNLFDLRKNINSLKNTGKVTKALELVAASKQNKTKNNLKNSRFLRKELRKTMQKIVSNIKDLFSPSELPIYFYKNDESNKVLIINVMSSRGLCGGINTKLFNKILNLKNKIESDGKTVDFISVNKISQKFLKNFDENVIAFFGEFSQTPDLEEIRPLINMVKSEFINYFKIYLAYSDFVKTGKYRQKLTQLLPIDFGIENTKTQMSVPYLFEPNPLVVINGLANLYIDLELYEAILSNIASENTARMISMKKATDNIDLLVSKLNLKLNHERQAKITQQCSEISANL